MCAIWPVTDHPEDYVEAVTTDLRENTQNPLDGEQTACMGTAIVEVVGVDALRQADISPDELGDADDLASLDVELPGDATDRLGAAFSECDLADSLTDRSVDIFTEMFSAFELPPDAAACLADNFENADDRALIDGVAAMFVDRSNEQLLETFLPAMEACPSVMVGLFLAVAPTAFELSPSAEACLTEFVEDNRELVARNFTSDAPDLDQEMNSRLATACPEATAAVLLAAAPAALNPSPSAEACLIEFVEGNPDLVARSFTPDPGAGPELDTRLAAACPELSGAFGG